jgi:hypothetical protein
VRCAAVKLLLAIHVTLMYGSAANGIKYTVLLVCSLQRALRQFSVCYFCKRTAAYLAVYSHNSSIHRPIDVTSSETLYTEQVAATAYTDQNTIIAGNHQ